MSHHISLVIIYHLVFKCRTTNNSTNQFLKAHFKKQHIHIALFSSIDDLVTGKITIKGNGINSDNKKEKLCVLCAKDWVDLSIFDDENKHVIDHGSKNIFDVDNATNMGSMNTAAYDDHISGRCNTKTTLRGL